MLCQPGNSQSFNLIKDYSSEIQLHTAQLLNGLSIYNIVMIKVSKTELKIQDSKLKLTSVAGFP